MSLVERSKVGGGGGVELGGGRDTDECYMVGSGGSNMKHSLSTPSGVDGTPSTPRHRGGKKLTVRIQMLDDTVTIFQVQVSYGKRFLYTLSLERNLYKVIIN